MKLMLAEDEPGLSRALTAILQHSDYEVDTALDGLTALEYLLANDYDAAILDIMMPGMDGIEVLKRTRTAGKRLPIIMLTAKSEVSDKVEGLDAGANDYLTKPFAAKELLARIRAMTRAATAIDATTLSVGNVRLDTAACTLVGPLGEEHLANREFQLMELFMHNAGTRMPTERLMLEVWGEDAPEGANVVWVYISYLRKKLTDARCRRGHSRIAQPGLFARGCRGRRISVSASAWWKRATAKLGMGADSGNPGRADAASAMGRRLRRKFILVAMGAVTVVLALIIAGINIVNYSHVCKMADARLDYILAGKDGIDWTDEPKTDLGEDVGAGKTAAGDRVVMRTGHFEGMTAESPFDTRYFTVSIAGGQVTDVNTARIAAVGAKRAARIAAGLYSKGWTSGFSGNYRYTVTVQGDETTYVFVDCSRELASFHSFLSASVAISCIGWLAVLAIVAGASGAVIRPMVESYSKQKRFITDASHEIKTPLAVIDAANEVQEIESGESEWTQSIHEQVARLTALTERLVFLARMDEGSAGFTMISIDLSEAVDKAASPFESVAVSRGKRLSTSIASGVRAHADAAAVAQVVELLLDNATRYASEGSVIELSLRAVSRGAGKGSAELVVSNAVDELPEGDLDRLFDRFYRADVSRSSKTGGSGVGLSVVRAIAEAHGGSASVCGHGNQITFTVRL
ncbi:MAG: response regulator [Collinsella sp.]|nr:response regulator [Collinsella sp.]